MALRLEYADISRIKVKLPNSSDIRKNGKISEKSIEKLKKELRVIAGIINSQRNNGHDIFLRAVGTAALRDAENADEIEQEIASIIGDEIIFEAIDGLAEAALCAYGITNFYPNANGVLVDMGGGSTEFAIIDNGKIRDRDSLSLGTASVSEAKRAPDQKAGKHVKNVLKPLNDNFKQHDTLFLSGGTFRNVNKMICEVNGCDIKSDPPPSIPLKQYRAFIKKLMAMSDAEWIEMPENLQSRRDFLSAANSLVKQLIKQFPENANVALTKTKTRDGLFRVMHDILEAPNANPTADINRGCELLLAA